MTTTTQQPSFDTIYEQWRPRLYRALAVVTGDADAALDAVDEGFSRRQRAITGARGGVPAAALGAARRRLTRPNGDFAGFRLPADRPDAETMAVVEAVRTLDLDDRLVLVASRYLGWDETTIGTGLDMLPGEVIQRNRIATNRILAVTGATNPDAIDRALLDAAERTVVPLSRLESVKRRARLRWTGAFFGAIATAAALGGGIVLAANTEFADDASDTGPVAGGTLASSGALAELEWNRAILPFTGNGGGEINALTAGDDGYVAISVDYGSGSGLPQIITSVIGLDWEAGAGVDLGPSGGWIGQLATGAEGWAAVGSTFDEANGRERPLVLLSADGVAWNRVEIPVADSMEIDGMVISVTTNLGAVAVATDSITVFGTAWGDFQQVMERFVPDDVSPEFGWNVNQNGVVDFYDGNGEIATSFTADELGISAELVAMMRGDNLVAYRTVDGGESWAPVPLTGPAPGWVGSMTVFGDTLLGVFGVGNGSALFRMDEGGWQRVDVGDGGLATVVATFDGRAYAAGNDAAGNAAVWRSTDGINWDRATLPVLADTSLGTITAGSHGIIASGYPNQVMGPAVLTVDDRTVTITTSGLYTVTDAAGTVLATAAQEDLVLGPTITISDAAGEGVVTIDQQAIDAAWQAVFTQLDGDLARGGPSQATVVASLDGTTWVRLPIDEALPPGFGLSHHAVGPSGVIVAGWSQQALPFPGNQSGHQVWAGVIPDG
ncbi:MAG: hypothetical protein M3349_01210 [Actinomycetota bacterium]|nr:hypothetical protein [Actinomycetota bacterium]